VFSRDKEGEEMKMQEHITIVAALKIGIGGLRLLIGMLVFVAVVGGGLVSGDAEARGITAVVGSVIALALTPGAVARIVGGIALLMRKPWARILVLVLAVLDLLSIPIGTVVGIYTIWVLLQDEVKALLASEAGPTMAKDIRSQGS
jgi:hypothetical protein